MLDKIGNSNIIALAGVEALEGYFATLARQLLHWHSQDRDRFAIGLMGCGQNVGTSTVAINAAIALSGTQSGAVLLVESDFGNASLVQRNHVNQAGLSDVLGGHVDPLTAIHPSNCPSLQIMGSGSLPSDAALHLPFHRLSGLLEELRGEFALVVVDLPFATEANCSYPLAAQLDGVALVAAAEQVDNGSVRRIQKHLPMDKLIGLVLNKAQ